MKTLIIFNDCETIKYVVLDSDYSRFNGITFNIGIGSDIEDECSKFLWDEHGILKIEFGNDISIVEDKQWDKVALITWIP